MHDNLLRIKVEVEDASASPSPAPNGDGNCGGERIHGGRIILAP